jgi:hydrogenase expression/formation protein HypD
LRYITEFRNSDVAKGLITRIAKTSKHPARFMEFCGGHTVAIFRYGIRQVLPKTIEMVSGPGCPVCVTATPDIDKAMVYSPLDALKIADENPEKSVVFLGIGFETTAPGVAASVLQAEEQNIQNYYVLSQHKLSPPAIKAILNAGEVKLNGLICPGHVSAITGSQAWEFIADEFGIPCVVSGFEPLDILQCIDMLTKQVEHKESRVEIAYRRGVTREGNTHAQELMNKVFEPCPANWRGVGLLPGSGLKLRKLYKHHDAEVHFNIKVIPSIEPKGCLCGEVLRGVKTPLDCTLFRKVCTPESPVGPCMVSSEGSCSAYYLYGSETI